MDWKSFFYGLLTMSVLLLAVSSLGFAHMGKSNANGISSDSSDSGNIPEKCRVPAGQDVGSWKEHLGHHAETRDCLQYFN